MMRLRPPAGLTTTLETDGDRACFVVRTDVALYQERIVHMGWSVAGATSTFVRHFTAIRWHRGGPRELQPSPRRDGAPERPVTPCAMGSRPGVDAGSPRGSSGIDWWLYGSAALAIRGLDVDPGDVDFTVSDACRTGELFADMLVEPVQHADGWGRGLDGTGRSTARCSSGSPALTHGGHLTNRAPSSASSSKRSVGGTGHCWFHRWSSSSSGWRSVGSRHELRPSGRRWGAPKSRASCNALAVDPSSEPEYPRMARCHQMRVSRRPFMRFTRRPALVWR